MFYKNSHYKAQLPVSVVLNVSPKILAKSNKVKHDEFKHFVYAFLLKEDFMFKEEIVQELSLIEIAKLEAIKEFKTKSKVSKSNKEYLKSLEIEVDLHIEELVENINGLSNFEMLNIQIEKFDKTMDNAFENNTKKIIFISKWPVLFMAICWILFFLNQYYNLNYYKFGVLPRNLSGLKGIIFSVFIHGDVEHIASNTLPILILCLLNTSVSSSFK